jgi:hypothetical protein
MKIATYRSTSLTERKEERKHVNDVVRRGQRHNGLLWQLNLITCTGSMQQFRWFNNAAARW